MKSTMSPTSHRQRPIQQRQNPHCPSYKKTGFAGRGWGWVPSSGLMFGSGSRSVCGIVSGGLVFVKSGGITPDKKMEHCRLPSDKT
jgi:hypothetical protein